VDSAQDHKTADFEPPAQAAVLWGLEPMIGPDPIWWTPALRKMGVER
jgi:hypothetical protein